MNLKNNNLNAQLITVFYILVFTSTAFCQNLGHTHQAANFTKQNANSKMLLPIICEFDDSKPICRHKELPPYCASVFGCEPKPPKKICLGPADQLVPCSADSGDKDIARN